MDNILKDKILNSKVISFDMFDTLVVRIIDTPEILFDMIGKKFNIDNFRGIRTQMQAECGLKLQEKYNYPHANIEEIYEYIKHNTDIENTSELMEYEISKEVDFIHQNKEIYEVYKFAKENKKRIIVTSDMYLDENTIIKMLNKCGYKGINRLYLSSKERKAKFDGTLYDFILKEEDVIPSEILHIGDSVKDDINIASSKGLKVYHYLPLVTEKSNSISLSVSNGINRLINQAEDDPWIKIGVKAGLLYLGLFSELEKMPYEKINFLARDGYNLYHLFKKYSTKDVTYCYTSRRALLLASINKIDELAKRNLPPFTFGQTIGEVLEYIGMENIFDISDLKQIGFNSFDDRFENIEDVEKFKNIYSMHETDVLSICEKERNYATNYFKNFNIFNRKNLFFDCGWNGSSQFLLENFIHINYPKTTFEFYYTGILDNFKSVNQLDGRIHNSYLFDLNRNQDIANRVKDCIVILELFFGAPENSVLKYDKNGVVFDNFEAEVEYKKKIFEGINRFFELVMPIYREFNFDINCRDAIIPILKLIESPSNDEAVLIGNIENIDAFTKQKNTHKFIANLTMDDVKNNPDIEIYWKYGLINRKDISSDVKKFISKKYNLRFNINSSEGFLKTIFKSIYYKINYYLNILFRKFKTLIKLIKKVWKKYHFIVPPKVIINFIIRKLTHNDGYNCSVNSSIYNPFNKKDYNSWLEKDKNNAIILKTDKLNYNPLISFVIPVYNVNKKLLSECLDSIINQTYNNIEICLADDCSTNSETIETLNYYEKNYDNVKVVYREKNGHISAASNSALELATGEYVAMMDNDDVIPPNAIYEMVKAINEDRTIDMIYTDEDKLDFEGNRCDPHFKSDYAPDTLLSVNYFCHFTLLKTSILREIGGWREGFEGAQDWDLFLRFTEKAHNVYHLPKVLYHWRMIPGSTSMSLDNKKYAKDTAKRSIEDALDRRKVDGKVHLHDKVPYYWIEYKYKKEPLVSIIIPTKDYSSTLDNCLKSIYRKTTYKNFEIIVVNNRSNEGETFKLFKRYEKAYDNFRVINADMEFNYSKINNLAVQEAKGEYVVLLNNDTEVITDKWLDLMVGYAMQSHIGAVGVKLIYPDKTIQHGGVVMGMGGVAGHAFVNAPMDYEGIYGRLCVPYNYSAVTAACLMVKKSKYVEVKGLTEELMVAYNDVDFCLKLMDKGYYNVMVPMVELFHYESKSRGAEDTDEKLKRFAKEADYMEVYWKKFIDNDPMYNKNLSRSAVFMLDKKK